MNVLGRNPSRESQKKNTYTHTHAPPSPPPSIISENNLNEKCLYSSLVLSRINSQALDGCRLKAPTPTRLKSNNNNKKRHPAMKGEHKSLHA